MPTRSTSTFTFVTTTPLGPIATSPLSPIPSLSTPTPEPINCLEELVLPQLTEAQPTRLTPGDRIRIMGTGRYVRDSGGYNESTRTFQLYLDDQSIGSLGCYVNHCEGSFTIPTQTQPGTHCVSTEVGRCGLEIQIVGY